ncbi:ferrochelatase [Sporolactobacillus shoreicorticis]|uniref:Coproporphyrin III ferrochelatase n=1 Tax=Sporolactobacillus shoreicorticis TaxID=1923877 RepID=A0ABW5S776_9BACL|nr:ferrochelatase [Sporolactobacillus shoreicorticis]MCO7126729.1 ferrochelatase [Sporolactobacillus shoreicorticis]
MSRKKIGLLVMAYGTPYQKEDIIPYYTAIRHGRKPSDEQIENLARRYGAIGGTSPLARLTREQADALAERLNAMQTNNEFHTYLGLKYIHPFIEDAVTQMRSDGIDEAVSLALAPHYSRFSVQSYIDRAQAKAEELGGITITSIKSWFHEPQFIHFWRQAVLSAFKEISENERDQTVVLFTAHSLPEKILKNGDPYPQQIKETARAIVDAAKIKNYAQAWQSAGKTSDPWLGPDVLDQIRLLHKKEGYKHFIFCPIGFVAEHLEVLYDNDQECRALVESLGASYHRPQMPDTDPLFIEALASAVLAACRSHVSLTAKG